MPRQQQHVETLDTLTRDSDDMTQECTDYTLNADSCWIQAGKVALWIRRDASGLVIVEAYEDGKEMERPIAPVMIVEVSKKVRCADCGEYGKMTGHQDCQYPQDHP
jgi:hypothetical protein